MVNLVHGLLVTDERSPKLSARGDATSGYNLRVIWFEWEVIQRLPVLWGRS
jgi:hypothetical protein